MKRENNGKMRIIPLGGLEKIGMNITAFEYEDSIIVVDCGLSFPEEDMLGIDLVIPDVTYLKDNIQKVKGFVITHGHEDHIGGISFLLQNVFFLPGAYNHSSFIPNLILSLTFYFLYASITHSCFLSFLL